MRQAQNEASRRFVTITSKKMPLMGYATSSHFADVSESSYLSSPN
jgi:hypothetical protein